MAKKYDPLWEIVGERVALQGSRSEADATCPYCHVVVQIARDAGEGDRFACGLCGGVSRVAVTGEGAQLQGAPAKH